MQGSPSAITQAGNLFMFVMHNPVRWRDPSGLFAIPSNSMNINIASKFAALLSATNTLLPPLIIFEHQTHLRPITMTRDGDNITINAFINIFGSGADLAIPGGGGITFRQAAINGIINEWGGQRGGLNVSVNVIDVGQGEHLLEHGQRALPFEIVDGAGVSNRRGSWSLNNPGRITLYTQFAGGRDRTVAEVERTSSHEFGHAIGVLDGIGFGFNGYTQHGDIVSLMSSMWYEGLTGATRLDIELAWHAQTTGRRHAWTHRNIRPIVDAYGIPRER